MKVAILCGGKGIRAFPFTECMPKPMLPVDGSPIIVQLIKSFIAQGCHEFVLAAGHLKNVMDDYFEGKDLNADITIVDTGENADTGQRIFSCQPYLGDSFLATYGDGLSDVPVHGLVDFHRRHGRLATLTAVPLMTQYGVLDADDRGYVRSMREKPVLRDHWINAGFMVFNKRVFDYWTGTNLERDVLPRLIEMGELYMYRHEGFFKSMDSYKDQQEFEELVRSGRAPWKALHEHLV